MKHWLKILSISVTLSILGCGSHTDSSNEPTPGTTHSEHAFETEDATLHSIRKSYFVGFQGLQYRYSNTSGNTDNEGKFSYSEDSPVSFYIGDILLGSTIIPKTKRTPVSLLDLTKDSQHPDTAHNIRRFLVPADSSFRHIDQVASTWPQYFHSYGLAACLL